jgi:hypothetical protein
MAHEERRRPPRIPLTPEEVARLVALKKRLAAKNMAAFKHSAAYRFCNVFNICCFFIYWELLFCFMGPCHYETHYSKSMKVKHGYKLDAAGKYIVSEVQIVGVNNEQYKLIVDDFIATPKRQSAYQIGKDYILQKSLRGILETSESSYRLQEASPLIFLSVFLIVVSCISFFYNLNEEPHSLRAVAIINGITMFAFLSI